MRQTLIYILMIFAAGAFAADEKPVSQQERPLTKEESLAFQLDQARIQRLQDAYKIAEYQTKVAPFFTAQNDRFVKACKSIGVPEDKISTECKLNTGVDGEGNPLKDEAGKPVEARVWREVTAEKK